MYPKVKPTFRERIEGLMERKYLEDYQIKGLFPMEEPISADQLNGIMRFVKSHSNEGYTYATDVYDGTIVISINGDSYLITTPKYKFLITSHLDTIEVRYIVNDSETAYYYVWVLDQAHAVDKESKISIRFVSDQLRSYFVAMLADYYERSVYHDRMGL